MIRDRCPRCGYQHDDELDLMALRSDSSLREIWDGKDGPIMQSIMRIGVVVLLFLIVLGGLQALHVHL